MDDPVPAPVFIPPDDDEWAYTRTEAGTQRQKESLQDQCHKYVRKKIKNETWNCANKNRTKKGPGCKFILRRRKGKYIRQARGHTCAPEHNPTLHRS